LSAATTSLSRGFVSACCFSVSSLPWNCIKERKEHPSVEQSAAVRGTMLRLCAMQRLQRPRDLPHYVLHETLDPSGQRRVRSCRSMPQSPAQVARAAQEVESDCLTAQCPARADRDLQTHTLTYLCRYVWCTVAGLP
jgi:hypothetical protein